MKIFVNGDHIDICGKTITDMMNCLELPFEGCAVAVGSKVVPMDSWDDYFLKDNDSVTIIKATQGG